MTEQFAQPGEVGLIYTDDKGKYHLLGLKPEQHQLLQGFVRSITKDEPAIKIEKYKLHIEEVFKKPLNLIYYGTSLSSAGHYFWNVTVDGEYIMAICVDEKKLPFNVEKLVPTNRGEKTLYSVFTDKRDFSITVLAFAGSPYDKRPGSCSVFMSSGEHSEKEMIEAIKDSPICVSIIKGLSRLYGYSEAAEVDKKRVENIIGKI